MRAGPITCVRIAALAAAVLLVGGCSSLGLGSLTKSGSAPYEQGSGRIATESRTITQFHELSAAQGVQVTVAAGSPGVTVTADDNLLAHVTTSVTDGVLRIDVSGGVETRAPLRVVVTTSGPFDHLVASTGATIDAEALDASALAVEASTGATVRGGGRASALRVKATTGATADLRDVESRSAEVDVDSGATAHVNATDVVTGSCTLGSTLGVRGTATTSGVSVDGTSSLGHE